MSKTSQPKHALVFGASGITGWAIFNLLQSYPTPQTWNHITGLTNRPLSLDEALVPKSEQSKSRVELASAIDLTESTAKVVQGLREKVKDITNITHVFFAAFIQGETPEKNVEINVSILKHAIGAVNELCPNLEMVVLQTGGKHYGVEFGPDYVPELKDMPYEESRPRLSGELAERVFYYDQVDSLKELSQGKKWRFAEIRPDVIVGIVPSGRGSVSGQDAARGLALYLSLWRKVNGEGSTVPFPGDHDAWTCTQTDSFQDGIARIAIYVSLYTDQNGERIPNGDAFNAVDGPVTTWQEKWPKVCSWFGLKGIGPEVREGSKGLTQEEMLGWIEQHKGLGKEIAKEYGLQGDAWEGFNWIMLYYMVVNYNWSREYDMSKLRGMGFEWELDSSKGWIETFRRLADTQIIPPPPSS